MGNAYLARQKAERDVLIQAAQDIATQYCVDIFTVLLHRRGYGAERMDSVLKEFEDIRKEYIVCFEPKEAEADVYREKLDRQLRAVYGDKTVPFEARYPAAYSIRYDKPVRHKKR